MTRNELHDHIDELADKVKYFNGGIRQSRFVEDAEVDLLEKYINALQRDIAALRGEKNREQATNASGSDQDEQALQEEASAPPQKNEHDSVPNSSEIQFPSEQDRNSNTGQAPLEVTGNKQPSHNQNEAHKETEQRTDPIKESQEEAVEERHPEREEEKEEHASQGIEAENETSGEENESAAPSGQDDSTDESVLTAQETEQDQEHESASPRQESGPEKDEAQQSLPGNENQADQYEEQSVEEETGREDQGTDQTSENEQMPEYIKQLLANKEERDQTWEDLEQEADEYGGQSYVEKIRELKRKADINPERPTLNERLKKDQPELSERINRHVQDIREAIGVNDRYLFISELFNGNTEAYKQTIEELNRLQSKEEAQRYVREKLEPMKGWQDNPRIAEKMNELIVRRFDES